MANIDLAVGQVNITANFLIARARKVSTPLVEETREEYPSPLAPSFNVVLPPSGSIDPVNYYVDFYESADGVALDFLLAQFVVNAKNNIVSSETRFYKVGGADPTDPVPDQADLVDPYLDGKTISKVFRRGIGPIVPEDYTYKEFELLAGGGIRLLNDQIFSADDIVAIEISYLINQTASSSGNLYNGVVVITANTTLISTHRNKRLRCVGASSRLVITLESLAAVPDGTFYHVTHNDGNQLQTKILPGGGDTIKYFTDSLSEITISPGEYVRIEKTGAIWEAVLVHQGVQQVGERMAAGWNSHPNTKPEDGTLYDGDDYPRMWWWLTTKLPATHIVTDDTLTGGGYVHPVGKEGLFVRHSTLKKFRLPNTQNWSERGIKSFTTFNADAERTYDYPGGTQPEMIGPHTHPLPRDAAGILDIQSLVVSANADEAISNLSLTGFNTGTENRVKNVAVVYCRRF